MKIGKSDLWTYVLTTAVTVVAWSWAAGETRIERELKTTVSFSVGGAGDWIIEPGSSLDVNISAEGSTRAINTAEVTLSRMQVELRDRTGPLTVDLLAEIGRLPEVESAGIRLEGTDPRSVELKLRRLVEVPARVVLNDIENVEMVGAPTVEPAQVVLRLPDDLVDPSTELTVTVVVDSADLANRQPGRQELQRVAIELPPALRSEPSIVITPSEASVSFTIGSRIRDVAPPVPVRVQIAGSPEDEYDVEVEPKLLRNVKVRVPEIVGRQIESGEVTVIALLHLKTSEKEAKIQRKPVTAFVALLPNGELMVVEETLVNDSLQPPMIDLKITERVVEGDG